MWNTKGKKLVEYKNTIFNALYGFHTHFKKDFLVLTNINENEMNDIIFEEKWDGKVKKMNLIENISGSDVKMKKEIFVELLSYNTDSHKINLLIV